MFLQHALSGNGFHLQTNGHGLASGQVLRQSKKRLYHPFLPNTDVLSCARWLNGLGLGARYDGTLAGNAQVGSCDGKYTGTVDALSSDDKSNLRHFIEAQLDAYERHTGWIFWTWKTESAPEWDMQALLAGGLFPQPLDSRQYPKQCNY